MKVKYDNNTDAKYISIEKGVVSKTQKLTEWLFIDYDKSDNVLGVEVLNFSKNPVLIFTDGKKLIRIETLQVASLHVKKPLFETVQSVPSIMPAYA